MVDKEKKVLIGIDLGGTGIKVGILNSEYEILTQTSIPTNAERPYEQIIADMGQTAEKLLTDSGFGWQDCLGVGVGSPGTIDSVNGTVLYSNNIRWTHVPIVSELKKYLPVPIYINNDANCAALGEVVKGAAKGYKNAAFLTLGTGVGGGIVIDGKIFEGGHPGGVELGHTKIRSEGRKCTCGRDDCLEAYASASALIKDAKEMAKQHPESKLWELCDGDLEKMNAKIPFDAAWADDECGKRLVESYIRYLADGIIDLVNIFRPDIVVLGGGVCAQGEKLTEPLNQYLQEDCFGGDVAYVPRVVIAENGNNAGIIGAASLAGTQNGCGNAASDGADKSSSTDSVQSEPIGNHRQCLFLKPVCTENIWGGDRLAKEFHYAAAGDHTGECWGISAHPSGDGTVINGDYAGCHLSEIWETHRELFGGCESERFPLLVKIIDAKDDLSIQVHPDDAYAKEYENGSYGKTECWYVLDCDEDGSLVIGHHAKTKEELAEMIESGRWNDLIREIKIKKGDFIQIDPGTVHAIKGGSLILETQQSSDLTYRLYDYDRLQNGKPRELHLKKSMDVITVPAKDAEASVVSAAKLPENHLNQLYSCKYYKIFKLDVAGEYRMEQNYPFLLMSVLDGEGCMDEYPLKKGDHFIVPNGYGSLCIKGNLSLMASTVG